MAENMNFGAAWLQMSALLFHSSVILHKALDCKVDLKNCTLSRRTSGSVSIQLLLART